LDEQPLTIGRLAKAAGVGVETIRFYEREGLIKKPAHQAGEGYRKYAPETVQRLGFIRRAKDLGFSLKEIRELLNLRASSKGKCASVKTKAQNKIADVERKIADLVAIKTALEALVSTCASEAPTSLCPILDALERKENAWVQSRSVQDF
jgi:MerR family mercuric resistance operon transcriptional regulator